MHRQMRYYYLDKEKKTQGPYTVEELKTFLQSGLISEETLVASAGESSWKSLASVFKSLEAEKSSTWNSNETRCPYCSAALDSDNPSAVCPHCGKSMYCPKRGIWGTFVYVIRNGFNTKGRAGRREFWLFYLVYYLIYLLLTEISRYLTSEQTKVYELQLAEEPMEENFLLPIMNAMSSYLSDTVVCVSLSVVSLYCLLMIFPFLSVSIRRLHDIGISATPVYLGCMLYITGMLSFLALILIPYPLNESILFTEGFDNQATMMLFALSCACISALFFLLTSIFMLVCMFIPGHPGSNKFGPAPSIK